MSTPHVSRIQRRTGRASIRLLRSGKKPAVSVRVLHASRTQHLHALSPWALTGFHQRRPSRLNCPLIQGIGIVDVHEQLTGCRRPIAGFSEHYHRVADPHLEMSLRPIRFFTIESRREKFGQSGGASNRQEGHHTLKPSANCLRCHNSPPCPQNGSPSVVCPPNYY